MRHRSLHETLHARRTGRLAVLMAAMLLVAAPAIGVTISDLGSFTLVSGSLNEGGTDELGCTVSSSTALVIECSASNSTDTAYCYAIDEQGLVDVLTAADHHSTLGFAVENSTSECVSISITNENS